MRQIVVACACLIAVAYTQEHFIDVRELVRDTLDAIKEVANNETATTLAKSTIETSTSETATMVKASEDNDVYKSLLKLPADIMSRLAYGAGFVEPKKDIAKEAKVAKKIEESQPSKQPQDDAPISGSSFKTTEEEETPKVTTTSGPAKIVDDDVFSISKLISATGNAIREAQAQQAALAKQQEPATLPPLVPLPQPLDTPVSLPLQQSEVVYRPVVKDGKTVFEQIVLLKSADGTTKIISQNIYPTLPMMPEVKVQKPKKVKSTGSEFSAPTFPPMINVFDQFSSTSTTTEEPTTTTEESTTTTEEPTTTAAPLKPRKKSLPRRTINYMGKKVQDMHSRQFGAKTVQMSEPIDFETQREETPNVLEKDGSLRVRTINRKRKYRKTLIKKVSPKEEQLDEAEIAEIPKKRRRVIRRKNIKKIEETKEKKEIRRFPDLYDEQQKIEVAPSVSPATEDFTEQFKDVDEIQQQVKPQNDSPIEPKNEKKKRMTASEQEEVLDKEIHKRVSKRIQSARTQSAEKEEEQEEEYDEQPTTTTTSAPAPAKKTLKKHAKKVLITRKQCLNLRSFARQFLFDSVAEFAKQHCQFIETYYPTLKCEKVEKYITACQKLVKDDE